MTTLKERFTTVTAPTQVRPTHSVRTPPGPPAAHPSDWQRVCAVTDLEVERGRAALLGEQQVALFLLHDGTVLAVQNTDPYSGASVLSRGIVGSRGDVPTLASPMFKQVFDLRTGRCLDPQGGEHRDLAVWPISVTPRGDVLIDTGGAP